MTELERLEAEFEAKKAAAAAAAESDVIKIDVSVKDLTKLGYKIREAVEGSAFVVKGVTAKHMRFGEFSGKPFTFFRIQFKEGNVSKVFCRDTDAGDVTVELYKNGDVTSLRTYA